MRNPVRFWPLAFFLITIASAPGVADVPRFWIAAPDTSIEEEEPFNEMIDRLITGIERDVREAMLRRSEMEDDSVVTRKLVKTEGAITFTGNTEIQASDTIKGDVVVKNGTLTVAGVIDGDALAINGNVMVKDGAMITGNARAINGTVKIEKGGTVDGYSEESSSIQTARRAKKYSRFGFPFGLNEYWLGEELFPDGLVFRYNRVEGLYLGVGAEKKFYWDGDKTLTGYGSAGYGFTIHRWRVNLGLDRQLATESGLYEFGVEGHSITDTKDEWLMKLSENNLVAFLWHEDYRDYFMREGVSVHIARYSKDQGSSTHMKLQYALDTYGSLPKGTDWSLFRQSRTFRDNPAVSEGSMRSVTGTLGLSTLERRGWQLGGWNALAIGEMAGNGLGGEFDFKYVMIDVRRFQPVTRYDNLNMRVRAGSLEGDNIVQRNFELGGANTMPAYGFKEFAGNRMLLGNIEYVLSGRLLDDVAFWPGTFNLILFADAGAVTAVPAGKSFADGFDRFGTASVKSDLGFAVSWHDGGGRLGFAWRTDQRSPVSVFFRFNKPF